MKIERAASGYIENKIEMIGKLVVIFILLSFLLVSSGVGLIAAISQSFSFVKSLWNLVSALGKLAFVLAAASLVIGGVTFVLAFITKMSNPKNWF